LNDKTLCPNCSKMEMVNYLVASPTMRRAVEDFIKLLGEAGKFHQGSVCVNCGKVMITDRYSEVHHFQVPIS